MATIQHPAASHLKEHPDVEKSRLASRSPSTQPPAAQRPLHRSSMTLAYWLSSALAVAALVASAAGVFHPALFRDPAMTAGNAEGTDLTILVIALPALLVSMILTARGSIRGQVVWLGALSYLVYNAAFFAFAVTFNQLFLIYIAVLSLAVWSLVALLLRIDPVHLRAHASSRLPVRTLAAYLIVTTALFALAWLRDICLRC
jgi:hypothetical protein